jgi:hypothetical protein
MHGSAAYESLGYMAAMFFRLCAPISSKATSSLPRT